MGEIAHDHLQIAPVDVGEEAIVQRSVRFVAEKRPGGVREFDDVCLFIERQERSRGTRLILEALPR
jgi:hypothetical protein